MMNNLPEPENEAEDRMLPESNRRTTEMLFLIEVGLRELIIDTLSKSDGAKWFKTKLPSDVSEKYVRGRKAELAASWSTHIEHHPIYYIDFPDLAKVLDKNWRETFQRLFGNKEVFLGNLKTLEPIRNTVAHNRKLSEQDCDVVKGILRAFQAAIGRNRLVTYVEKCSIAPPISKQLAKLIDEIYAASEAMTSLAPACALSVWPVVKDAWWFDCSFLSTSNHSSRLELAELHLSDLRKKVARMEREVEELRGRPVEDVGPTGVDITDQVGEFFSLFEQFAALPRSRGTGHKLESWKNKQDISLKASLAIEALNTLMAVTNE